MREKRKDISAYTAWLRQLDDHELGKELVAMLNHNALRSATGVVLKSHQRQLAACYQERDRRGSEGR